MPEPTEPSAKRAKQATTTIFLVRHGARWDFANKEQWRRAAETHGFEWRDPPLSALGHEQARCTAKVLAAEGIDAILVSPYLRVIQTAQPLAHATGLPLCIEDGLAEVAHIPGSVPPAGKRFPIFPEVDADYESLHTVLPSATLADGRPEERFPEDYLRRLILFSKLLPKRFAGKTVACFSHAASIALVAALTGQSLYDAGVFAPVGIFKLVSQDGGESWVLERHGEDNSGHVSSNHPGTYPWGFKHAWEIRGEAKEAPKEMVDKYWTDALAKPMEPSKV